VGAVTIGAPSLVIKVKEPVLTRFVRLALLACAVAAAVSAQSPTEKALALMDRAAASFKGLTAEIAKTKYTFAIKETEIEKGAITVKRPGAKDFKVLYNTREPAIQQTEFSGRLLRVYNPKTNIIQEVAVDKRYGSVVNDYLLLGFGSSSTDLRLVYNVGKCQAEAVAGQAAIRVELTPKKPDTTLGLTRAEIWISEESGIALQQKLSFASGDYVIATYSNIKLRSDIPDSAVKLNAPGNAKTEKVR
jgi:outer membrane lipoprotein-sorting protein